MRKRALPCVMRPHSLLPSSLYLDPSHCLVLAPATLAALPSTRAIETRSLPALARFYPCSFTFYVADPSARFLIATCSMSLTRDLPIRSVGFPPTNAVHPPASQHGVFIPFAPFGRCNGKRGRRNCPLRVDARRPRLQENAVAAIRDAIRDSRIATFANKLVWVC